MGKELAKARCYQGPPLHYFVSFLQLLIQDCIKSKH